MTDDVKAQVERDGMPDSDEMICPVCGADCITVYKDKFGNFLGCDDCVTAYNAWEVLTE